MPESLLLVIFLEFIFVKNRIFIIENAFAGRK